MTTVERIIKEFDESGVESQFSISGHEYRIFAYPSPARFGTRIRWKLYELNAGEPPHGLTFGIAEGVREAVEDLVSAATLHAETGETQPTRRTSRSFRPPAES